MKKVTQFKYLKSLFKNYYFINATIKKILMWYLYNRIKLLVKILIDKRS